MRINIETLEQMTEQPDGLLLVECNGDEKQYVRDLLELKDFDASRCRLLVMDDDLTGESWSVNRKTWKSRDFR